MAYKPHRTTVGQALPRTQALALVHLRRMLVLQATQAQVQRMAKRGAPNVQGRTGT